MTELIFLENLVVFFLFLILNSESYAERPLLNLEVSALLLLSPQCKYLCLDTAIFSDFFPWHEMFKNYTWFGTSGFIFRNSQKGSFYYSVKHERKIHLLLDQTYYLNFLHYFLYWGINTAPVAKYVSAQNKQKTFLNQWSIYFLKDILILLMVNYITYCESRHERNIWSMQLIMIPSET